MKFTGKISISLLAFMLSLSATAQTKNDAAPQQPRTAGVAPFWQQVPVPPLHAFHPQEPRRVALPNGMVIFLQEDHELPLIDGTIRIRGGRRDEPAEKTGMTAIYSEAWRTGGTKSKSGDELDDFLETRAALVETGANADSTTLGWSSLKGDFDATFAVVLDLLQHPEFRQDKIDLARHQISSAIARRNDNVGSIVQREAVKLAYGGNNPYARTPEYSTVNAVTRDDLIAWHKRTVISGNMIVGIAGDFDSAAMESKLREAFAALPQGAPLPAPQVAFQPAAPGIYFVEKDDVNQSDISLLDLGIERRNPDYYALEVMNEVFGGGFSSRLVLNLRTRMGLAYSVFGSVGASYDHPGIVRIGIGTKSGSTGAALEGLRKQVDDMKQRGVTADELKRAKDAILNSFIFTVDSRGKVLAERLSYEFYGYPPDFLERYRAGIEKVTAADVDRVAKKYLHPEQFAILVVGNKKDFDRDLSTFGKVTTVDVSIKGNPGGAE
ncbi:MAG TPA: pitrilysin family protein [Candidatus Angelobacter sp.]|nr:pitrilysin family protein [Candidatus Angelobacter sp.]